MQRLVRSVKKEQQTNQSKSTNIEKDHSITKQSVSRAAEHTEPKSVTANTTSSELIDTLEVGENQLDTTIMDLVTDSGAILSILSDLLYALKMGDNQLALQVNEKAGSLGNLLVSSKSVNFQAVDENGNDIALCILYYLFRVRLSCINR